MKNYPNIQISCYLPYTDSWAQNESHLILNESMKVTTLHVKHIHISVPFGDIPYGYALKPI